MDPDKARTMVRSILPSTMRRSARLAKHRECRKVRRATRHAIRTVDQDGETRARLDRQPDQHQTVMERRAGDKLRPFIRWCDAQTRGMSDEAAIGHVRGLVPKNLVGEHAMFHWRLFVEYGRGRRRAPWSEMEQRERQSRFDNTCQRLRRLLTEAPDFHGALNHALKLTHEPLDEARGTGIRPRPRARLLAGRHDVEAFVRESIRGGQEDRRFLQPQRWTLLDRLLDAAEQAAKLPGPMELQLTAPVRTEVGR